MTLIETTIQDPKTLYTMSEIEFLKRENMAGVDINPNILFVDCEENICLFIWQGDNISAIIRFSDGDIELLRNIENAHNEEMYYIALIDTQVVIRQEGYK